MDTANVKIVIVTEQEETINAVIKRVEEISIFLQANRRIELQQGQMARYVQGYGGQELYGEEAELVVRVPFGTPVDEAVNLILEEEGRDFKTRYPGDFKNAAVMHRGPWSGLPYINQEKQYWVLSKTVSYVTA